jgi:hypothetical protein
VNRFADAMAHGEAARGDNIVIYIKEVGSYTPAGRG